MRSITSALASRGGVTMAGLPRRRRPTLVFALLSMVLAAQVAVGATAAEARCNGAGGPVTSTLGAGTVFVVEQPKSGTCNGNTLYQGTVRANLGRDRIGMVGVWIQNNGTWTQEEYTNISASYEVQDANSNTLMTLCWYEPAAGAGVAHCGWGSTYGPVGTTPGTRPDIYNQPGYHGRHFGF